MSNGEALYEGKVALVTGGARGIGRAVVERFLRGGARVAVCDVQADAMEQLRRHHKQESDRLLMLDADVRDAPGILQAVTAAGWQVDILVNNAALAPRIPSVDLTRERLNEVLDVNLSSAFELSRLIVQQAGAPRELSIVNISSVNAFIGQPEMAHYNASKAALMSLTRTLAVEWADRGVRVNAVCPGSTWTDAWEEGGWGAEDKARFAKKNPLGRFATPDEIAGSVMFLCGPDAHFITGHGLVVDGGLTATV